MTSSVHELSPGHIFGSVVCVYKAYGVVNLGIRKKKGKEKKRKKERKKERRDCQGGSIICASAVYSIL